MQCTGKSILRINTRFKFRKSFNQHVYLHLRAFQTGWRINSPQFCQNLWGCIGKQIGTMNNLLIFQGDSNFVVITFHFFYWRMATNFNTCFQSYPMKFSDQSAHTTLRNLPFAGTISNQMVQKTNICLHRKSRNEGTNQGIGQNDTLYKVIFKSLRNYFPDRFFHQVLPSRVKINMLF